MKKTKGFTLIEICVVFAILSILAATAIPAYRAIYARAIGSEAAQLAKEAIKAEIAYFLEHDTWFPETPGGQIEIRHNKAENDPNDITDLQEALNIKIPEGHALNVIFYHTPIDSQCLITIEHFKGTAIFKGGKGIRALLDTTGKAQVEIVPLP